MSQTTILRCCLCLVSYLYQYFTCFSSLDLISSTVHTCFIRPCILSNVLFRRESGNLRFYPRSYNLSSTVNLFFKFLFLSLCVLAHTPSLPSPMNIIFKMILNLTPLGLKQNTLSFKNIFLPTCSNFKFNPYFLSIINMCVLWGLLDYARVKTRIFFSSGRGGKPRQSPVSYTHLTLPTKA